MLYNYVRFGPIADVAAALRPGISEEPWFQRGLFHPSYSLRHLRVLFLALPVVVPRPPYLLVPWGGLALWITTPGLGYALRAPLRWETVAAWLGIGPSSPFHATCAWVRMDTEQEARDGGLDPLLFLLA